MTRAIASPANFTFTGQRYEFECPCEHRIVRYHRDAPELTMADLYNAGWFDCPMCGREYYVNRIDGIPNGKII